MVTRGRAYRCVGGPYDDVMLCVLGDDQRVRLRALQEVSPSEAQNTASDRSANTQTTDYQVRRLLAPDGKWHEFLVSSSLTTMQATVWLNRRR
jgi:hypothetical protein